MNYRKLLKIPQNLIRRLSSRTLNWLALGAALPCMGMVAAFALVPGTGEQQAEPRIEVVTRSLALPELHLDDDSTRYWRNEEVRNGETVSRLLNRLGVRDSETRALIHDRTLAHPLLRLKPGATLSVQTNDNGDLYGLRFLDDEDTGEKTLIMLNRQHDGRWQVSADPAQAQTVETLRTIAIGADPAHALSRARIPAEIGTQLSDMFSDAAGLSRLRPGDRVELIYRSELYQGSPIATGPLLAARVTRKGKTWQGYYFAHDSESGAFYDAAGHALKQGFSHAPVTGARISSGFGLRVHPLLHSLRMHEGVDYAAPTGTPVVAPADGVVAQAGEENGYGNRLLIRHSARLTTLYGHLNDFAPGIRPGVAVRAGQLIGHVGASGRVTGAHLHFEVSLNGERVDPTTGGLQAPRLDAAQRVAFARDSARLGRQLALLNNIPGHIAQVD
ncbi:M23 family metallopeptidase [Paludibacterium yongneupense]|uniref:M23 family metallopeptidase n=1 Tax=Paludibacterium yongneupense TaxID=400061 RepID=UPI0004917451|nr:M23 family metallopeptidase [Paludibacterium yongneupense]